MSEVIHYLTDPTPAQLDAAARLIDGTLKRPLKRKPFRAAPFFVLAVDAAADVIGVAAIRKRRGGIAEIGYFAVEERYRRQGIATRLTAMVIAEARRRGIELLYAWVDQGNTASISNLAKSEFRFWGNYVKRLGVSSVKSWFYLPLSADVDCVSTMEAVTRGRTPVAGRGCRAL